MDLVYDSELSEEIDDSRPVTPLTTNVSVTSQVVISDPCYKVSVRVCVITATGRNKLYSCVSSVSPELDWTETLPKEDVGGLSFGDYCTESYICPSTCFTQETYYTSCGIFGWGRCTRYRRRSYTCTTTCTRQVCCDGYEGLNCDSDINECLRLNGGCQEICVNTAGSFYCACQTGYLLDVDIKSCIDINECATGNGGCQHTCVNTAGSFRCACLTGYLLDSDTTSCFDINECASGNGGCQHTCMNTVGSFYCACETGYLLDLDTKSCNDIDECASSTSDCAHNCNNSQGSYVCSCNEGYSLALDNHACEDIDECAVNTVGCEHYCNNTVGSFTCSCRPGYALEIDGKTCTEDDECSTNNGNCDQICVNSPGSYECVCQTGYNIQDDKHSCEDIDECAFGLSDCEQNCINTPGTYNCGCNIGYQLNADGRTCADINDCATDDCQNGGTCLDGIAYYTCQCSSSFTGRHCESDVDECTFLNGGCEDICTNTFGSYSCGCSGNGTLKADGKACSGGQESGDVFQRHKIPRKLLPRGCSEIMLTKCTDGNEITIYLSSTSDWYKLKSNEQLLYTHGIVFAEVNSLTVPVSLQGVEVSMAEGDFEIKLGAGEYPDGAGESVGKIRTEDCWLFDLTSKDIFNFVQASSFLRKYLYSLLETLPDWIKLQPTNDTVLDVQGLKSDLTYGRDMEKIDWCRGAPVLSDHLYSVFLFDTSFSISIYENPLTIPKPLSQKKFCLIVDLCHNYGGTVFLLIPKESQDKFSEIDVLKELYEKKKIKILPRGFGLSVVRGVNVHQKTQSVKMWNGDHTFNYPVFQRANLWIGGNFSTVSSNLEVHGSTDMFVSVPNPERILTAMFIDEWNALLTLRVNVTPIIKFRLFGKTFTLPFSHLVDIKTDVYMSVGDRSKDGYMAAAVAVISDGEFVIYEGDITFRLPKNASIFTAIDLAINHIESDNYFRFIIFNNSLSAMQVLNNEKLSRTPSGDKPRVMCGDNANPPGLFLSTVIRINPFQDVPILRDWSIENANTIYVFFMTDPTSQITDDFKINIKNDILQVNQRIERFKQFLRNVRDSFEYTLDNSTQRIILRLVDSVNELGKLTADAISNDLNAIINIVTDTWKLYTEIEKSVDYFIDKVQFIIDTAKDNFTSLLKSEKYDLEKRVKAVVQTLRDGISLAEEAYLGFGLKYTTSIVVKGFKFVGLDIEFVYSTSGIGNCTRFSTVYKLLEGQRSARFLGTFSKDVKLGRFITADIGMGIGGAFGIDKETVILRANSYINMLGIKIIRDMFITERGLYFFWEGNLWNIFLAQVDVSAEQGDDWYKLVFKLEGRFVATARKKRQVQTGRSSFQASYLDALKKVVTMISDETEKRITQAQEGLEAAKEGLSKAQEWLDEKKKELQKANAAFDDAISALERAKEKLEKAKEPFERALEKLRNAQRNVDKLCRIKECRNICIPGIKCRICRIRVGFIKIPYPCCRASSCMISFKDPICIARNLICKGIRYVAYAALEAAKLFVKAPMIAFDVAKAGVSVTQFVVDKSRVVVDLAEGVLDLANVGLEGAKGLLDVAKGSLEAVKVVVGAAARVLELVIEYGVKNIIDVRNCGFSIELSTTDLPVFDVSCEVNAFKLGWKMIRFRINFKNAFQAIWQAAKAAIKSVMKQFRGIIGKRSIDDITYKSTLHVHKLIRSIREAGLDYVNQTNTEEYLNETIDAISEMEGFTSTTDTDYDNRVLLFREKCARIGNILNFFNDTFGILHGLVNESVSNFQEIDGLMGQLNEFNTSNIADNMTLEDAEISEENALSDYNITTDELGQALSDAKSSLVTDPELVEISKSADFSKGILESELKSIESANIISQWILAMENVTRDFFDESECVDFRDCIFHSVFILYDLYTAESLPDIALTQQTISNIEDNILELFQNTSDNARGIYNTSSLLSENIKTLTAMNLFCSEAPSFTSILENITVTHGATAKLRCQVTADPQPVYWWYKNKVHLELEMTDTLVIVNVSKLDEGMYSCTAGNVVANITSNDAHLFVKEVTDIETKPASKQWFEIIYVVPISVSAVVILVITIACIVYRRRRNSGASAGQGPEGGTGISEEVSTMQYENRSYDNAF